VARGGSDNRLARWAVYNLAYWIVRRRIRQQRRKLIAVGVIGAVVVVGAVLARASTGHADA
jgi:hypothetical protein